MTESQTAPAAQARQRINWINVATVLSAAILIGAEVFGAAYAGGWAFAEFFGLRYYLGDWATYPLQAIFAGLGVYVMAKFLRMAARVEPFVARE